MLKELLFAVLGFGSASDEFPEIKLHDPYTVYHYLENLSDKGKLDTFAYKEKFLKHIGSVNIEGKNNSTVLNYSITANKPNIVKWLCQHGADVNKKSLSSMPYLYFALLSKTTMPIADILLDYNADPDIECAGETPLHLAIRNEFYDVTKRLLEKSKKHINTPDETTKWTPLYVAITNSNYSIDIIEFLIKNGADMMSVGTDKKPFEAAVRDEKFDVIQCFIDHGFKITASEQELVQNYVAKAEKEDMLTSTLVKIQKLCQDAFDKSDAGDTVVVPSS